MQSASFPLGWSGFDAFRQLPQVDGNAEPEHVCQELWKFAFVTNPNIHVRISWRNAMDSHASRISSLMAPTAKSTRNGSSAWGLGDGRWGVCFYALHVCLCSPVVVVSVVCECLSAR